MTYPFSLARLFATALVILPSTIWFTNAKCGGKTILKALEGSITDGPSNYPARTQCEWLIEAPQPNMTITLEFIEYETECTYDYLFVYDGPSYMSWLLGSFSGNNVPEKLVASSGKMLIHLFSDTNYVKKGFEANYTIENCSKECSAHGSCSNGQCTCDVQWRGKYCDLQWCPDQCHSNVKHGECDTVIKHCKCHPGFVGESCSLPLLTNDGSNGWYKMVTYSPEFTPRIGHAAVYDGKTDTIWSFGGYNLNSADDSLLQFNMSTGQWIKVLTQQPRPVGRYSHTASLYNDGMFVFGGQMNDQQLTNDFWKLNITTLIWTQINDPNAPPPVAMHTATVVDDYLYIFGGRTMNESFTSGMSKYGLSDANSGWRKVKWKSGKQLTYRVIGHSTVYHEDSRSLVVFGGFSPSSARRSIRMNKLHAFHIDELVWSEWVTQGSVPKPRSFHSTSVIGDYIILFGGTVHKHNSDETCYDNELHFFHLRCRKWIPLSVFEVLSPAISQFKKPGRGRYSHAALPKDSTLMIFGGYSGTPRGDMYAYKLPIGVAMVNVTTTIPGAHCNGYKTSGSCSADPACGWCESPTLCFPVQNSSKCSSGWKTTDCPGPCGVHAKCASCLAWGSRQTPKCGWCVQDSRCYPQSSPQNACEKPTAGNAKKIRGWWGTQGQFLNGTVDECRSSDYPPGLTVVWNIAPKSDKQPDKVTTVLSTEMYINYDGKYGKIAKTSIGFVYPFKYLSPPYNPWCKFHIWKKISSISSSKLYISIDASNSKEKLAVDCPRSSGSSSSCVQNGKFFPSPSRDKKYFIRLVEERTMLSSSQSKLSFRTSWNGTDTSLHQVLPIHAPYLQPYSSEGSNCDTSVNCLKCISDASCGWCDISNSCVSRTSSSVCRDNSGHSQHLVLNATECSVCGDYVDCTTCAQQKDCEWLSYGSLHVCIRRGIPSRAQIRDPASCNVQCERRNSCSQCLADNLGCAWCDKTFSCFLFGSYITRYPYGECSNWLDSELKDKCKNCSIHTTCKTCLSDVQCGWCASTNNPLLGRCAEGDFGGPKDQCSSLVNLNDSVAWSYSRCPDVDECRLGLHDCHHNATCHNVYDSYNCVCNRGYTGDGKTSCNKTCDPPCVHGTCTPDYKCRCDLGWIGVNCSIDCGCHGHSTCNNGIGKCDKCQDYTHGNYCELCIPGSYGNATSKVGCKRCDCNGHGDVTQGECDIITGKCYCKDNTVGEYCEQCLPGLKGNSTNGGRCYYECSTHSILTNVTQGDISTEIGSGVTDRSKASCLWVISASTNTSQSAIYGQHKPHPSMATITLHFTTMNLSCSTDHVDVYDGIPYFILNVPPPHPPSFYKLGSFCGPATSQPKHVTSVTGNMVVVFHGNIQQGAPSTGFAAIFKVNRCTDSCHGNRQCIMTSSGERCVCRDGWLGSDCNVKTCPNNCSLASGRGTCNMETAQCECTAGFTGSDCSTVVHPGKGSWETLFMNRFSNNSYSDVARMAHTMVVHSHFVWMFGGYSMALGILDNVIRYDVITKTMSHVTTNQLVMNVPKARYFHCAVLHQDTMVVHGGVTQDGVSNEMWYFNVKSPSWTQIVISGPKEPKVAGHTCTLVGDIITIIGGYEPHAGLNNKVYQYSIPGKTWSVLEPLGTPPTGLYGHTTVYHASTQSLFVFGGYRFKIHEVQPSGDVYTLHIPSRKWNLLQALPANQPVPKFFHSAAMLGDVMVVYGGRSSISDQSSSELLVYKVNCNHWHTLTKQDSAILGVSPGRLIGASSSSNESVTYIFGGFNGQTKSSLYKLKLPSDLCQGMRDKNTCSSTPGCSWCELRRSNSSSNQSYVQNSSCYSVTSSIPSVCHATSNVTQTVFVNGSQCNVAAAQQRVCGTYSSCAACLSLGVSKCKWCLRCSGGGKCVDKAVTCDSTASCQVSPSERTSPGSCPDNSCEAPTCADCLDDGSCMWTPQLKWLSETRHDASSNNVAFPWNCFKSTLKSKYPNIDIAYKNVADCPKDCTVHKDCRSCLTSTGGDGGWKECVWSETLGQCYSPSYLPMAEVTGVAGRIIRGSPDRCMPPCVVQNQCASCFQAYNCGWCSKQESNGLGVCMEGGLKGPIYGTCQGKTIDTGPQTPANMTKKISTQKAPVWASVLCPAENECLNGRHNCMALEDCEDTPESFKCVCKTGYERQGDKCVPVCDGGCGNGTCVTPNNCSCTFGWTSRNCSMKCYCNNHGHCLNETTLDICYDCSNHTMGTSCQLCSPLYVGNATNNGTCRSCYDVCNKSAHVCMSIEDIKRASDHNLSLEPNAVRKWLDHGPVDIRQDRECLCRNNSRGIRCKHCIKEHFFLDSYCKPCQCNGHGDTCNDSNGRCPCHNNTKSDCRSSEPCYNLQCVKCKDNYLGRPSDSRQCYSKVTHLNEFAISSKPGLDLNGENNVPPLPKGSTRSYVVYPRYTNVDIRTIIDVFQGGLDVYVSTFDRTFAVHVNNTTWIHRVQITHGPRVRRNVEASDGSDNPNVINVYAGKDRLNTFVGLHSQTDIIKVRAVQRRLVLTFPFSKHQLRTSRFYMIFLGVGDGRYSDTTGIVYFRQDLSQIDLFVFFSVFFSVFFLVLAFCIVAWKMKQFHDRRRIAHVQEQELETMASRPFATYSFLTDMKSAPHSCWKIRREHSRRNLRDRKNHNLYMKEVSHRPVISPVAHQVSGDSRVAVVSVMFQLPSNENSDFQLAFGSVITTNSHQHSLGSLFGYPLLSGHKANARHTVTITS